MKIFLFMVFLETLPVLCVKLCKIWELDYHIALSKSWGIQHATHGPYEAFKIEKPHIYIADSFQKVKLSFYLNPTWLSHMGNVYCLKAH